ncbi:MAG TPA: LysR family transcriptional regulator [Candidatus Saccharimonadales bacterium]|nr:LysR family transcriptional regulator [Candidatus Saccharimonadales bacterium]
MFQPIETAGGFTIDRLRTFCKIAESGSIVAAAKGDTTRQSQFSRQVKELEEFFCTRLLERSGKSVRLTDPGRKLAVLAQSFFRAVEDMRATAVKDDALRIGAGESVLRWLLAPRMQELMGLALGVRFEFQTQRTSQLVDSLKNGRLDIAVIRKDGADDSLKILPCGVMKYIFVVPRLLLPGRTADGFRLLPKIPFAMPSGDGVLTRGIRNVMDSARVSLDIQMVAENASLLIAAIENADIAAIVPAAALADLSNERFATVPIEGIDSLTRSLVLAYSPEAAAVRENIRRLAPRISGLLQNAF